MSRSVSCSSLISQSVHGDKLSDGCASFARPRPVCAGATTARSSRYHEHREERRPVEARLSGRHVLEHSSTSARPCCLRGSVQTRLAVSCAALQSRHSDVEEVLVLSGSGDEELRGLRAKSDTTHETVLHTATREPSTTTVGVADALSSVG